MCVYFSRKKELWTKLFEQDKKHFVNTSLNEEPEFVLADDNVKVFIQQIKQADTIYMRGGRETLLFDVLSKVGDINELFEDKVVGGSSAGANVLSRQYYSNSRDEIKEGLGILPIKVFCHYDEIKIKKLQELKENGAALETYSLPEQEYVIIQT